MMGVASRNQIRQTQGARWAIRGVPNPETGLFAARFPADHGTDRLPFSRSAGLRFGRVGKASLRRRLAVQDRKRARHTTPNPSPCFAGGDR